MANNASKNRRKFLLPLRSLITASCWSINSQAAVITSSLRDVSVMFIGFEKCFDVDGGHMPCSVDLLIVFMNLISRVIAVSVVAIFVLSAFAGLFGTLLSGRWCQRNLSDKDFCKAVAVPLECCLVQSFFFLFGAFSPQPWCPYKRRNMWIGMSAIGSYLEHLKVLRRHYVESDLRDGIGNSSKSSVTFTLLWIWYMQVTCKHLLVLWLFSSTSQWCVGCGIGLIPLFRLWKVSWMMS